MNYSKLLVLPTIIFAPLAFAATSTTPAPTSEMDKVSYSIGVKTGENFNKQTIKINPQQFYQGMSDALSNKKTALSEQEIQDVIKNFQKQQMAQAESHAKKVAADNLVKGAAFLQANKSAPNVKTLSSGLQYIELAPGKGNSPKAGDSVTVNYRGTLIDGKEFDSSYSRNESSTFPLEGLIPAWQEALVLMKPGAKWKIFVPAKLAYGEKGVGNVIEPNSTLIFEIELVDFKPKS